MLLADRFTDLLTAWSTFGGAVGPILAVVVAYLLLRREIRSRNEEKRDAEAGTARLVTVEIKRDPAANGKVPRMLVAVRNLSSEPVHEIEAMARSTQGLGESKRRVQTLDPRSSEKFSWTLTTPLAEGPDDFDHQFFETGVVFTDSRGLRWTSKGREQPQRWLPGLRIPLRFRIRWWLTYRRQDAGRLVRRGAASVGSRVPRLWSKRSESAAPDAPPPES